MWTEALVALVVAAVPAAIGYLASRSNRNQAEAAAARASRDADAARASVEEVERLKRLEERVRELRVNAYKPMLDAVASMLEKGSLNQTKAQEAKAEKVLQDAMKNFWRDSMIYASDRSQRAFGRMMQGAFHDAPSEITMRLYAEWVLAARADLGDDQTQLSPSEVWAPKLTDLFKSGPSSHALDSVRFADLAARFNWVPPWTGSVLEHQPDEERWGVDPLPGTTGIASA